MGTRGFGSGRRRVKIPVVVAGVVFLLVLSVMDWWQSTREMRALLAAAADSEAAMVTGMATIDQTVRDSRYARLGEYASQSQKDQAMYLLREEMSSDSATALAQIQATGAEVENVFVLPWHVSLRDAKDAYLAHSNAWVAYTKAMTKDPSAYTDKVHGAEIRATFETAEKRFSDAIPPLSDWASERVDLMFSE